MTETKYGVISDVHENPELVRTAIEKLKSEGVDKLFVNGDIGGNYGSLKNSQGYTAQILEEIGKSGLESYVQPGSHETLIGYEPVIKYFAGNNGGKYSNVIDVLEERKFETNGHSLVFLPGSDFLCGGEYQIGNSDELHSGMYAKNPKGLIEVEDITEFAICLQKGLARKGMNYSNINDLRKMVKDPDKTIVVCHVPRKFDNLEESVDMAEFGEAVFDFPLEGKVIEKGSIFPFNVAKNLSDYGMPVQLKKENRGNEDLRKLYEEIGIKKSITGHFHESAHRANDLQGRHVQEGEYVDELFWMGSYLDGGKAGILKIKDDGKVSYLNIDLK